MDVQTTPKLEPVNNRIKILRESVTLVEGAKGFLALGENKQAIEALLYSQAITNRLLGIILTEQKIAQNSNDMTQVL